MGVLTLDDIERRAKARGWLVDLHGEDYAWVYSGQYYLAGFRRALRGDWYCTDYCDKVHGDYLDGTTEAREGAARVLSVVAQVAALLQGQRLAWVAGAGERVRGVINAVRVDARHARAEERARREVLRLRHRLRSYHEVHPSGDRVRPEDLDALLYRAKLAPLPQSDRTYYLARELRGRRERGASVWPRPRGVHGPVGRLP